MNNSTREISVIGLGHFGKFFAEQLSKHFLVHCFDSDESKDSHINSNMVISSLEDCLKKEYIFLTLPIRGIHDFLKLNSDKFTAGTTLVDCASVKVEVLKWRDKFVPVNVNYFSIHPLFGPDSAKTGLRGHTIVYTADNFKNDDLFATLVKTIGVEMQSMSAEEHDLMMAYNLNLVHLLGRALNDLNISGIPIKMRGIKYLDEITQFVMNDNKTLFLDFFTYNPYAKSICKEFANSFNKISAEIGTCEKLRFDQVEAE